MTNWCPLPVLSRPASPCRHRSWQLGGAAWALLCGPPPCWASRRRWDFPRRERHADSSDPPAKSWIHCRRNWRELDSPVCRVHSMLWSSYWICTRLWDLCNKIYRLTNLFDCMTPIILPNCLPHLQAFRSVQRKWVCERWNNIYKLIPSSANFFQAIIFWVLTCQRAISCGLYCWWTAQVVRNSLVMPKNYLISRLVASDSKVSGIRLPQQRHYLLLPINTTLSVYTKCLMTNLSWPYPIFDGLRTCSLLGKRCQVEFW